ncbi:MAG: nicotinamide-nucleotide amidohydrolase family protein [Anaerolineae bacterium]|nr:nicotinamide-nucleotide amidohydrolase family protein [Anaerolineae bacterium]
MPTFNELAMLAQQTGAALLARGWQVAAAESCTGGLLLSTLTDVPGSSAYVAGGVVCYSNASKEQVVGVPAEVLHTHGAVSAATASALAEGIRRLLHTPLGIGITGIAGPGGGTPDKPVGLVYIGLAGDHGVTVARHVWPGDRHANKQHSVHAALTMILAACAEG